MSEFVEECLEKGVTSPSEMCILYNEKYPRKVNGELKPLTRQAFTMALRRLGISSDDRITLKREAEKEKEFKDIMEYEEVKRYFHYSKYVGHIGKAMINRTTKSLRTLFSWMVEGWEEENGEHKSYPNPREWNIETLGKCMEKNIGLDENGQWKNNTIILELWGAYNRCFQGRLPKGWSMGLKRPAGELKDFFEYTEFEAFIASLRDTEKMSLEGWTALYKAQVNMGCREGAKGNTGIISLKWEDINYKTKRCKIRDKGKKGKPARLWGEVPLDLFPWVKGWEALTKWHQKRYGYYPTQDRRATGKVFPIAYVHYLRMFHSTRKRAGGRIGQNLETMRPHIFRKTHAQWAKRIGVTLDNLCGDTTSSPCIGRYGVGWDDPKIPLKYYLTKEVEEYIEQDMKIQRKLQRLGFVLFDSMSIQIPTTLNCLSSNIEELCQG